MNDDTTTTTPSMGNARERVAECDTVLAVIGERLAEAEAELAGLSLRDPKRHTLRRRIAEMKADLDDAQAQKAKLGPILLAETREAQHNARVVAHARAMQAAGDADAIPARMDRIMSELCRLVPAYLEWAGRCASAGGVEPHPYRLGETVPSMDHVRDVVLARMVAAGILDTEFMPQHIVDAPAAFNDARAAGMTWKGQAPPDPMQMAASASFAAVHAGFKRALASAAPDRQRREASHLAELSRQRAAREAEAATKPLPKLPAPPPAVVHSAAIVIGR
jgi:hypothetical protein